MTQTKLEKLREQEAALKDQIKEAKRAEKKRAAERLLLRCTIIGSALVDEMADNQDLAAQLEPIIERRVTKTRERKLLGLPPTLSK